MLQLLLACTPAEPEAPLEQEKSEAEGHWVKLDTLAFGHKDHTATRLGEQIVVLGGFSDKVERIDLGAEKVRAVASLPAPRMDHAAAGLPDGRLLVAGGTVYDRETRERTPSDSALIWDPESDAWSEAPPMSTVRTDFALVAVEGGVLAIGGLDAEGAVLGTTERFDGQAWTSGPAVTPRHGFDIDAYEGGWLITGGRNGNPVGLVEHLVGDEVRSLPALSPPRADHVLTVLSDGSLLVTGGDDGAAVIADVDQFVDGAWFARTPMSFPRAQHGAGQVEDGRVVVFGGRPVPDSPDALPVREVEIYEADGAWRLANRQVQARYEGVVHTLDDGRVMIVGGHSRGKVINEISVYSSKPKPPRVKQPEDTAPPDPPDEDVVHPPEPPGGPPGLPPGI